MHDRVLVTGGLGFIGANLIRSLVAEGREVVNVDAETYAGDKRRLQDVDVRTVRADVASPEFKDVVLQERPSAIVHLAAETHVTRGENLKEIFWRSNVDGTRRVLEAGAATGVDVVLHISTDEVYGPCTGSPFREDEKGTGEGRATSIYAKSKAVADDLATSFRETPVVVARPTNCFGPWQHPEKAIARWSIRGVSGMPLPVWGDGRQSRDWMSVTDCCRGLTLLLDKGSPGEVYNLGPGASTRVNIDIARDIARIAGRDRDAVYLTAYDRPHHDRRYAVDASKIRRLGWEPQDSFQSGLERTVAWYAEQEWWWKPLVAESESIYADESRGEA